MASRAYDTWHDPILQDVRTTYGPLWDLAALDPIFGPLKNATSEKSLLLRNKCSADKQEVRRRLRGFKEESASPLVGFLEGCLCS